MEECRIEWPDLFDEEAIEIEMKGCFDLKVVFKDTKYELSFYDPSRMEATIVRVLSYGPVFFEENLLVIETVTKDNILKAIESLVEEKRFKYLLPAQ